MELALTTLCSVKGYIGIPESVTIYDNFINANIPRVSHRFNKWCDKRFGVFQYTEYLSGTGTPILTLKNTPTSPAGLQVWVDNTGYWGQGSDPFAESTLLEPLAYALEIDRDDGLSGSGTLLYINSVWPEFKAWLWVNQSPGLALDFKLPNGNVKVVYTGGELPEEVEAAANMTLASWLVSRKYGAPPISLTDEVFSRSVEYKLRGGETLDIPPQALSLLAPYKSFIW